MEASKYDRSVPLRCPTCGATEFAQAEESEIAKCASCGREITKDELMRENSENIQEHMKEIAAQAAEDLGKALKKNLKDAFRNNKFIKIK